ncbi:uncharacterized protein B0I36DRAFT_28312 [Microdochium trichocladiopsis]|uniref:Uncharacterized protein n=1 Tax=Microdochium trichocladiopsis TaxID=1682393 RepID=A0A9P8XX83_9PEZI|nr:uncharacterized protein B0I36DRAFT_28312 [Microdochium trichocladiopsis]KAH7021047.1 hypothetical protein B0I36DRAFT_28312 [Microdochium trichocladiopsis]
MHACCRTRASRATGGTLATTHEQLEQDTRIVSRTKTAETPASDSQEPATLRSAVADSKRQQPGRVRARRSGCGRGVWPVPRAGLWAHRKRRCASQRPDTMRCAVTWSVG